MAPFDTSTTHSNAGAYVGLTAALYATAILLFLVSRTLVRAHRALPVAHRTRAHDAQRRSGAFVFAVLAALSLAVNIYTFQEVIVDSYWNWAFEHKQVFPVDVWTTPVWFPRPDSKDVQFGRWMRENDMKDGVRVMAGSWRDYWWQQQHAMGTAVWAIFLAIEGMYNTWQGSKLDLCGMHAYTTLRSPKEYPLYVGTAMHCAFIGLSVAQNLFYLVLLFTPVPLPAETSAGWVAPLHKLGLKIFGDVQFRPHTWVPKPSVYIVPLVLSMLCTALLPYGIGTPFQDLLLSAPQVLCYVTLLLTKTTILSTSFGTHHRTIHSAHASSTSVFRTAAIFSFILYGASTTFAILSNTPPAQRSLFGILFRDYDPVVHSALDRYRIAVTRVLGALSDHPVVQRTGWDVLLSSASLCVWSGFRGLDPRGMLSVIGFPVTAATKTRKGAVRSARGASTSRAAKSAKKDARAAVETAVSNVAVAASLVNPIPTKHKRKISGGGTAATAKKAISDDEETTPFITRSHDKEDTPPITRSHKPTASTVSPPASPKARKAKPKSDKNAKARDSEQQAVVNLDREKHRSPGAANTSTTGTTADLLATEHEENRSGVDGADGAEGAALAWGFCILGGLGLGMAGMAGGEAL